MSKDSKERIEQAKRDLAKTLAKQNVQRIKFSDKKKSPCKCNIEDDGGRCEYCDRSFEKVSSFVMHVAQNKRCKEFYGKNIETYKMISKRISKQKWYCQNAHGPNAKRFKEERKKQRQANNKKYYVPKGVRYSECGKAFEAKFVEVYQKCLDVAKEKISQQCVEQRYLRREALDEALENTFKDCSLDLIFKKTMELNEDETLILEETFERLESTFDNDFEKIYIDKKKAWKDDIDDEISATLFSSVYNKVFLDLYEKSFKEKAEDNTLDTIFLTLLTTDKYFNDEEDLETQMNSVYYKVNKEELKKLFEENIELENKMKALVEKALGKIFRDHGLKY